MNLQGRPCARCCDASVNRPRMKLPLASAALPLLLLAAACASSSPEALGRSSSAVVSATTTYLLPVEDDVREACRSTWTRQWCNAADAQSAADACVTTMLASSSAPPACAATSAGCFQLLTETTPCTGDGPIYPTPASCQAPVEHTCAFYSACLEADQPCGADGYALGYGEKYCSRFDVDETFSPQGIVWRDAVLHCLQLALVPELPKADTMTCDALTTFAFDSHPRCYTGGPSICFLPVTDITNVLGTIDGKDLLSLRSAKQMVTVAADCVDQIAGALFDFDDASVRARLPEEVRDRAALGERLKLWQSLQQP